MDCTLYSVSLGCFSKEGIPLRQKVSFYRLHAAFGVFICRRIPLRQNGGTLTVICSQLSVPFRFVASLVGCRGDMIDVSADNSLLLSWSGPPVGVLASFDWYRFHPPWNNYRRKWTFYSHCLKDGNCACQGTEHFQQLPFDTWPIHSSYPLFCINCVCASCAPLYRAGNQHLPQKTMTWEWLLLSNCVVTRTPW